MGMVAGPILYMGRDKTPIQTLMKSSKLAPSFVVTLV